MQESTNKFGPFVSKNVEALENEFKNVVVTCSKSGQLTRELYKQFLEKIIEDYVKATPFVFIIDSWGGQTDAPIHDKLFEDSYGEATCTLKIIPQKCTPLCQPCDVYFYRQFENFLKSLQNAPAFLKEQRKISSWEDAIRLHSLLLHQFSAPAFQPILKYAWFASKLVEEMPIFLNLNDLCFPLASLKKNCSCSNVAFIKCSRYREKICFTYFYD